MIQFNCSHCRAVLRYTGSKSGARVKCPRCQQVSAVPMLGSTQRRLSNRRMSSPVAVLVTAGDGGSEPAPSTIINRSEGGLCLTLPDAVPQGTTLKVRLALPLEDLPWVPVKVRHCQVLGNRWKIGCQYVGDPSEEDVLLFG